ncbi:MAG TPA: ABC transporter permease [Candidatus Dormibacteraeota bacterium]|nr:ABC transporter permease [Candidatus Dormibacteraeota bacterium]
MRALESVGRLTLRFLEYAGGVAALGADAAYFIVRLRVRLLETINQAYLLGTQSTIIVLLTSLFTGMVISLEAAEQAVQYGFANVVGGGVAYTTSRELGPMLTAVVVAGRVGAAIAAELGTMVVTEQVEALEALGLSPTRMLVVPRLLAMLLTLPILTIFADVISVLGGMWMAKVVANITPQEFITSVHQAITMTDVAKGLFKTFFFAIIIVLVGCYQGLTTRGGAAGVGKATTFSVVLSIILIFIANFTLSYILFR